MRTLGMTWQDLASAGFVLLAAAVVVYLLRWLLRRLARAQARKTAPAPSGEATRVPWLKLTLEALLPPLTLFLWVLGVWAALMMLSAHLAPGRGSRLAETVVGWGKNAGEIGALFWFFFRMIRVVELESARLTARSASKWDDVLLAILVRALRLIVPLAGAMLVLPALNIPTASDRLIRQGASLLLIGAIGFVLYELANAVEQAVLGQFRIDVKDNLEARKVYTQVKVLKKIAVVVIVIFTSASMLMVFDSVRQLGTSLLASAGVVGIIVGFAAQKSIATVLAGFQIAMTQPIRLDDVVIVENEWGRIEEITLTYVVVLIWDQRRLIVPISYFIERPFQNWTRVSADLLGSVFLYLDYTVPLDSLRAELDRLLGASTLWDGKVKVIQVTDSKENQIEVRVLVSASDASKAWDLRCELREKLIEFLQRNYPRSLPRARVDLLGQPHATAGSQ